MRLIVVFFLLTGGQAFSQLIVRVNDAKSIELDSHSLAELPRRTALLNDHGKQLHYEGVLLHDVLVRSGIDFGKGLHGAQLSSYVAAIGADGYEVVYALSDFDPSISDSGIIIADKRDGSPLDPKEGPLRIVVPQDQRPARSVRLLKEIDVVQLKK